MDGGRRGDHNTENFPVHTSSITSCIRIDERHEAHLIHVSYPVIGISPKNVHITVENETERIRILYLEAVLW